MRTYKVTDSNGLTQKPRTTLTAPYVPLQWSEGSAWSATSGYQSPCSSFWISSFISLNVAELLCPLLPYYYGYHYDETVASWISYYPNHLIWEADTSGAYVIGPRGLKVGSHTLTTNQQVAKPVISDELRVTCALQAALAISGDSAWNAWASDWLNNVDRTLASAVTAEGLVLDAVTEMAARTAQHYASGSYADSARHAALTLLWAADRGFDVQELADGLQL